jgi:choline dehydrogenase-like flavoprotein
MVVTEDQMNIVIGSGPAGVAAASALLEQGRAVTLLDIGGRLEPATAAARTRMGGQDPEQWSDGDVAEVRGAEDADGVRSFGSDFLVRDSVGFFGTDEPPAWFGLRPSFAAGGLSNGWGASILPYRAEDIQDWPISGDDLAPHYNALKTLMPIAAKPDRLADLFPLQTIEDDRSLDLSTQAKAILGRLENRRDHLRGLGVHFGHARQAVSDACRSCAMCLTGCPYGLIFNAAHVVERFTEKEDFTYLSNQYVIRFREEENGVRLWSRDVTSGETVETFGERLFVAAGVLPTARLVLSSLGKYDHAISLRDSHHFFVPMLQGPLPRSNSTREARNTLTQLFVEIIDPAINARTVHFQIYAYNDRYAADMRDRFGGLAAAMGPLVGYLSRRLIVAQGFIHSDDSASIDITLRGGGADEALEFAPRENPDTPPAVARAKQRMSAVARAAGLLPLPFLGRPNAIGSSFHCGGTFPMSTAPVGLETDTLGRPVGLRRVHLVDASVFPSVPATTITLSVMANAHRIATGATRQATG